MASDMFHVHNSSLQQITGLKTSWLLNDRISNAARWIKSQTWFDATLAKKSFERSNYRRLTLLGLQSPNAFNIRGLWKSR